MSSELPPAEGIKQTPKAAIYTVLIILFAMPLLMYLFFLNGEHHFETLPVMRDKVASVGDFVPLDEQHTSYTFKDSVTVVMFLGKQPFQRLGHISNFNEKIYRDFHKFEGFQLLCVVHEDGLSDIKDIKYQLQSNTALTDWHFIVGTDQQTEELFSSMAEDMQLNDDGSSDHVFLLDKQGRLRGRPAEDDEPAVYGYYTGSIAEINNVMIDDLRILLAEYRMAFKKNRTEKLNSDE